MELAIFIVGALFGGCCVFLVDLVLIKKLKEANHSLYKGIIQATKLIVLMNQRDYSTPRDYLQ